MLRRTYQKLMQLSASRHAPIWLGVAAYCEGIFQPIPPDVMLAPMVLARRDRAFTYAAICTVASVLGGATGYAVGFFLHPLAHWILSVTGNGSGLDRFEAFYARWGLLLLALPIPYKLVAIASGLAKFNLPLFLGASLVVRGARFTLVAWLTRRYGAPVEQFVEKRLGLVVGLVAATLVGLVMLLKWLF